MSKLKIWDKEFGISEYNGKVVVSSIVLAEIFEKRHDNVLRDICRAIDTIKQIGYLNFEESNFILNNRKNRQNKLQPEYLLTKDGFAYIAMGFTGNNAAKFKVNYISKFNKMEDYITALNTARLEFPELTEAIQQAHEEPQPHHFSNEMDLINKIVLGVTAKQFKVLNGLSSNIKSIRPYLGAEKLRYIGLLQKADIGLVLTEPDIRKRKRTLEWYYGKMKLKRLSV